MFDGNIKGQVGTVIIPVELNNYFKERVQL